ncbi:DUF4913 domain-containing protein [uncultured Cellulomonas sp.]|uniref:DUF4913 domain-containing protein n=1 Tax=uncultured Cellulomonas sp. TaxID=189682 RepID=UPI00262B6C22|nr:DUF4913 domain-containing protein [uncultured Cellulomonas sp.]
MTTPPAAAGLTDGRDPWGADAGDNTDEASAGAQERTPVYEDVVTWVEQMMLPHYRRPLNSDTRWCAYWWQHTEAVARLEACWRAWEHLRYEGPTGIAVWFRDYFDPMMGQLTGREGPFHACRTDSRGGHQVAELWPSAPAPAELFRGMTHPGG